MGKKLYKYSIELIFIIYIIVFMSVYFYFDSLEFSKQYSLLLSIDDYINRDFGGYIVNKKYHGIILNNLMFFSSFLIIIFCYLLHSQRKLLRKPNSFFNLFCCFIGLSLSLYFIFTNWQMFTYKRYSDIRSLNDYILISCGLYIIFISETWIFSDVVIWAFNGFNRIDELEKSPNIDSRYFSFGHIISCIVALAVFAIIYGSK